MSIVVSVAVGGYSIWCLRRPEISTSEYYSWLGVSIFFFLLALLQIVMIPMMLRKKKFD